MTTETRPTFTPGPWEWRREYEMTAYDEGDDYAPGEFVTQKHWALCRPDIPDRVNDHRLVLIDSYSVDLPAECPDAHLIAAAPEMYEALRRLIADNCLDGPECGHVSAVRAALARAEGR